VNVQTLSMSAILFYMTATASRLYSLRHPQQQFSKPLLLILGVFAVSLHALLLYYAIFTPSGVNLGIFNAASLMMWMVALLLLLSLTRSPVDNLVVVLFPLAAITILANSFFDTERIIPAEPGVKIHVFSAIIAYSLFSICALQAVFIAVQDYQLRHKHPGRVIKLLPPLQVMEHFLFQMLTLGFLFLTLGLITGVIFLEDIFAQHLMHKTVLSSVAWCLFAVLLWGHWQYGWRGKTAIKWSLSGFFMLMLAYFGSKLVLEVILQRV